MKRKFIRKYRQKIKNTSIHRRDQFELKQQEQSRECIELQISPLLEHSFLENEQESLHEDLTQGQRNPEAYTNFIFCFVGLSFLVKFS